MSFNPQTQLPKGYLEATPSEAPPASEDDDLEYKHYLINLNSDKYQLLHPILYKTQYEEGTFLVIAEEINLWGEGATLEEAEKSLVNELLSTYENLLEHKEEDLGSYPSEILSFLKENIKSEAP